MKRKQAEKLPVKVPHRKTGTAVTAQEAGEILVLDIHKDGRHAARYCMDCRTGEHEVLENGTWRMQKFQKYVGYDHRTGEDPWDTPGDRKLAEEKTGTLAEGYQDVAYRIGQLEYSHGCGRRERAYERKTERINTLMETVPPLPGDLGEWYLSLEGDMQYLLKDGEKDGKKQYRCTACGGRHGTGAFGKRQPVHGKHAVCPGCRAAVLVNKRKDHIYRKGNIMLLQELDGTKRVARHFDAAVEWGNGKRRVSVSEAVRIVFERDSGKPCVLYRNQYTRSGSYLFLDENENYGGIWWDTNSANRRINAGYLYPAGIRETLEGTQYAAWTHPFEEMAQRGWKLDYNEFMRQDRMAEAVEMLAKNGFKKLVAELAGLPWWEKCSRLELRTAENIREVFRLGDRQRIRRIRDMDGGFAAVGWMQHEEQTGTRIRQETLEWLEDSRITPDDLEFILDRMTANQVCNYIRRQQLEPGGYRGSSPRSILAQWQDYTDMCRKLGKRTDDEMVYRPRELKRRHDEAAAEMAEREAEITADEYSSRFPGAEKAMREVREKFEYTGEEYLVTVPQRAVDIVLEGRALHHCAGSTDRYFNRMEDHETYICFLRKTAEPEKPFYTIEVEPGGTIRQHRGYLDEEPEIEKIRPFLREWQKEIKKRMTEEDRRHAERAAVLRDENIRELEEKNNTRVLEALRADFMEAV